MKRVAAALAALGGRLSAAFELFESCAVPGAGIQDGSAAVMPCSFRCSRDRSLLLDPGSDRSRRVAVESPVEVFGDETDMRRRQQVFEGSERVLRRQGLGIENIDRRSRDGPRAQGLDKR